MSMDRSVSCHTIVHLCTPKATQLMQQEWIAWNVASEVGAWLGGTGQSGRQHRTCEVHHTGVQPDPGHQPTHSTLIYAMVGSQ
mmetsp:Transcript_138749/g.241267  ORF Transcript_138749/g.241267 Transcript_138749/m.241267 type:complete len:83 (+) Transcript_138749:4720-4968(+)